MDTLIAYCEGQLDWCAAEQAIFSIAPDLIAAAACSFLEDEAEDDPEDADNVHLQLALLLILQHGMQYYYKNPIVTADLRWGGSWVMHHLISNREICKRDIGMTPETFSTLTTFLVENCELRSTRYMAAEERLAIALCFFRCGSSTRHSSVHFARALPTIIGRFGTELAGSGLAFSPSLVLAF